MRNEIWDFQTMSINFSESLSNSFNKITHTPDDEFNIAFVIQCSALLKSQLEKLGKI